MEGPSGGSAADAQSYIQSLGKKLLRDKSNRPGASRWSLKDGREDKQSLEDMGLFPLERKCSRASDSEDLENRSPNMQRAPKRSHSKASPVKEADFVPSKISAPDDKPRVLSPIENVPSSSQSSQESVAADAAKGADPELLQASPHISCGPHPPFHKYPQSQSMSRHTTFDDDTVIDLTDKTLVVEEQNVTFEDTLIAYEPPKDGRSIGDKEEWDPDRTILAEGSCDERDPQRLSEVSEKECFVLQNSSYCNSHKNSHDDDVDAGHGSPDESDGFAKLFDELVLSIFQWLPKKTLTRCMLVCKRWHRLALNSRLWSRVCLGGRVLNSGALPHLMMRHPIVLRLANAQLSSPVVPDDGLVSSWRVQFLDLSAATIEPECLARVLRRCPALLRLSLEGLALCEDASAALARLAQLRVLNLALTTNLGRAGARAVGRMPRLEALNVAWTRLDREAAAELCGALPATVQRLNLSGFRRTLTEKLVETVVERCPNLVELDLSDCIMMGDRLLPMLLGLTSLEHLAISRCHGLKRTDFVLLNDLPCLQWVDVFGLVSPLSPITLSSLSGLLPKIKFNQFIHSSIARPTVGNRRTSIWGLRTRD